MAAARHLENLIPTRALSRVAVGFDNGLVKLEGKRKHNIQRLVQFYLLV